MKEKEQVYSSASLEDGAKSQRNNSKDEVRNLEINQLVNFENHPFKVETNTELFELMQSIEREGILEPLLARPNPRGDGYELISGHRRKAACEWAGIKEVPVIIRDLDDSQAVVAMVNSNLHREHIKPSEKAFAYRMKLEAMKQQGKRNDLTIPQVEEKLKMENPTLETSKIDPFTTEKGEWGIKNVEQPLKVNSNIELARQVGESRAQVERYIRLTNLIPQILDLVDENEIAFTVAVELSYLKEDEQYELYAVMDLEQCTPSLSQANRLKRMSQKGELDMDDIYSVLEEEKPNQIEKLKINANRLDPYFPSEYTTNQKVQLIEKLVKNWHKEQKIKENSR